MFMMSRPDLYWTVSSDSDYFYHYAQ